MITKRTKIMLAVLVLVALGAYGYLYCWANTDEHGVFDSIPVLRDASQSASDAVIRPQVPAPGTKDEDVVETPAGPSVTYRTFENTEFGFSFDYPETWDVSQTKVTTATTLCLKEKEGTGGCLVTITRDPESINVNADKTLEAFKVELREGSVTESTRRIGGEEADLLRASGNVDSTRAAVFVHDMAVYSIEGMKGQEAVFDRVASSLSFTD